VHGYSEARLDSQVMKQVCDWATHTAFTTHSPKPTRPNPPNHLYHISTSARTSSTISPSPRAKLRGGKEREGVRAGGENLAGNGIDRRRARGAKGAGRAPQGAGQDVRDACSAMALTIPPARRAAWWGGFVPTRFARGPTALLPLSIRRRRQDGQRPAASGKTGAGVAAEQHGPPPLGRAGGAPRALARRLSRGGGRIN
jgi:hypothetical protein